MNSSPIYILISLIVFFPIVFSLYMNTLVNQMTEKERQEKKELEDPTNKNIFELFQKFEQCQKAAIGFKIVAVILVSMPIIFCIAEHIFYAPKGWEKLSFYFFYIPMILLISILSYISIRRYTYLFYVSSNKKAFFILMIPFIPTIGELLISLTLEVKVYPIIIICYLIMFIMPIILHVKRKRLNAKQDNQ